MIRLVSRTLIIPRGDTGYFTVPQLSDVNEDSTAVFTIFDPLTRTKIFNKQISTENKMLIINFTHFDTVNLPVGKYKWDIKYYINPVIMDNQIVDGVEVNSYYSAFSLPDCEVRQTGDTLLTGDDAPISTLSPQSLNIISNLISELQDALQQMQDNVTHYPKIVNCYWYVWDAENKIWVDTGVKAQPDMDEYVRHDELFALTTEDITNIIHGE